MSVLWQAVRAFKQLPVQQASHVTEQLVGANRAIAVLFDEALCHLVDLFQLMLIRRFVRRRDLDDVFEIGEQLLLDRFAQTVVRAVVKTLPFSRVGRDANEDFFTECPLGIFRDADLLLDRTHQALIWVHLLTSDGVTNFILR